MISIIIPVYNAKLFLDACIKSVLNQEYENFELLLVNDGSTDGSAEICDIYKAKDRRVKVFHKKNGGVSSARNLGIKKAVGEWITFIDSDDYISENYFQPVFDFAEHDLVIMNSNAIRDGNKTVFRSYNPNSLSLDSFLRNYNLFKDLGTPWGKFFKKSIIDNNNLLFDEQLNKGEDVVFNLTYILKCNLIGISNSTSYNYNIMNSNNLSSKNTNISHTEYLYKKVYHLLYSYSKNLNFISKHISLLALGYFLKILNSDYSKIKKKEMLRDLLVKHKEYLISEAKGQRFRRIPLNWIIKYEWINLAIFLNKRIT